MATRDRAGHLDVSADRFADLASPLLVWTPGMAVALFNLLAMGAFSPQSGRQTRGFYLLKLDDTKPS